MRASILRTQGDVQRLAPSWIGLPVCNPFSSWEYARGWLEQPSVQPFVIVVQDDLNRMLALAPWCVRTKRGGIRQLEGIRGYDAWFHDPWLLDPALERSIGDLLFETLLDRRGDWDSLELILTGERSPRLIARLEECSWGFAQRPGDRQHRKADLDRGWEAYWKSRSKDFRSSLRSAQRKLDALSHRYLEAVAGDPQPIVETAIRFSQLRWDPEHNRDTWYQAIRDLAAWSAPRGELFTFGLEIEGQLAAASIAFRAGDRAYGTLQGFTPEYASFRIGNLLNAWVFERLAASGIRVVEMGDGAMEWKERMKTGETETVLIQLGATLPGKALVGWKHWIKPQLSGFFRRPAVCP